jgi:hypothetical protein
MIIGLQRKLCITKMLYGVAQIEKRPILNTNLFISLVQIIKKISLVFGTSGTQLKNPVTDTVVILHLKEKK